VLLAVLGMPAGHGIVPTPSRRTALLVRAGVR